MTANKRSIIYSEHFHPWFLPLTFFLPWFWNYGVLIEGNDENYGSITFGYGIFGPTSRGLCSHTTKLNDIDKSSIVTGDASAKDNLFKFGGWGIRFGRNKTWAYNAAYRGPFCEFVERHGDKSTRYRIATESPEVIASILAQNTDVARPEKRKDL